MSDPNAKDPSAMLNKAVEWVKSRSQNEWIMFAAGMVLGALIF